MLKLLSLTSCLVALALAYVSYSLFILSKFIFPPGCSFEDDYHCLNAGFKKDDTYQLFLCTSLDSHPLIKGLSCFHHEEKLYLDKPWSRNFDITLPEKTVNNGSLFLHAILTRLKSVRAVDPNMLQSRMTVSTAAFLTKYDYRKDKIFNLLDSPKGDHKRKQLKKPETHWRSKMILNGQGTPFSIPRDNLPEEILHLFQLDHQKRYLPLLYLSDVRQRLADVVELPVRTAGQRTPVVMPLEIVYEPTNLGKFRMMMIVERSFRMMNSMGFTERDVEDVKGIFFDTNHYMLLFTVFIVTFHALFDFLAFKNDIQFWRNRRTMEGVSFSSTLFYFISQCIISLYLFDRRTSYLVLIPAFFSALIELWKLFKICGIEWSGWFSITKREMNTLTEAEITTSVYDNKVLKMLNFFVLPPLLIGSATYSIMYSEHRSLYSWVIETAVNGVYAFGFFAMLPQLILNYRLKSVAHLPWRMLSYKAFNTFIDDFFAFLMTSVPTSHRLATFRDDIVFLIYLYQRWLYPIDKSRSLNADSEDGKEKTKDATQKESKKNK